MRACLRTGMRTCQLAHGRSMNTVERVSTVTPVMRPERLLRPVKLVSVNPGVCIILRFLVRILRSVLNYGQILQQSSITVKYCRSPQLRSNIAVL